MTPRMIRALFFHQRISKQITGRQPKRRVDASWEDLSLETEMEEAGFKEKIAYVLKSQNTVAQYIATQPNMDTAK